MAVLNTIMPILNAISPSIAAPGKMWHLLILNSFSFIADYGWRIVVFTLILKLVLSPLDFYQRYKMNKNQKITERLKPTMDKLRKQYGNDSQRLSQMQMELNRKEGYSYFSSWLPMIATMVVFITLWLSMNTIASYMSFREYAKLYDAYKITETAAKSEKSAAEAEAISQAVVVHFYYDGIDEGYVDELRSEYGLSASFDPDYSTIDTAKAQSSFLWIKNIWAPDVPWGDKAILSWESFSSSVSSYSGADLNGLTDAEIAEFYNETTYNKVMHGLLNDEGHSKTNGYLILPILVVLLSVGTQLLSMYQQKRAGQVNAKGGAATSMKVMMFIMPVMMAIFAVQYASIFAVYMVINSASSLMFNVLFTTIIKLIDRRRAAKHHGIMVGSTRGTANVGSDKSPIIHYVKGANPHAGERPAPEPAAPPAPKEKGGKKKKQAPSSVRGNGRPDPNELMNIDMSGQDKK